MKLPGNNSIATCRSESSSRRNRSRRIHIIPLALIVSAGLIGCVSDTRDRSNKASCCAETLAANSPATNSLYDLRGAWVSDAGKEVTLDALRGEPRVVAMFYASCEMTCPMTLEVLRGIEAKLPSDVRERVGFVLITLDPQNDTPRALRSYRRQHGLAENRWMLLHGSPASVSRTAAALGVTYGRDAFGRRSHSAQVSLLNEDGRVVLQQPKLTGDFKPMVDYLRQRSDRRLSSLKP